MIYNEAITTHDPTMAILLQNRITVKRNIVTSVLCPVLHGNSTRWNFRRFLKLQIPRLYMVLNEVTQQRHNTPESIPYSKSCAHTVGSCPVHTSTTNLRHDWIVADLNNYPARPVV